MEALESDYVNLENHNGKYIIYGEGPPYSYKDEEDDCEELFFKDLSELLPENEVILWHEMGNEKYRYFSSGCYIITRNQIEYIDLLHEAVGKTKTILKNDKHEPDLSY